MSCFYLLWCVCVSMVVYLVEQHITCASSFVGVSLPPKCLSNSGGPTGQDCGTNSYVIMSDSCEYMDQQNLKLQESPEVVPTGEMPRNILLTVDRHLVDRVSPGTRVSVIGVSSLVCVWWGLTSKPLEEGATLQTSPLRRRKKCRVWLVILISMA